MRGAEHTRRTYSDHRMSSQRSTDDLSMDSLSTSKYTSTAYRKITVLLGNPIFYVLDIDFNPF